MEDFYREMRERNPSVQKFHSEVWMTRASRFQAAKRLRRQASAATWTIALASALLVVAAVAPWYARANSLVVPLWLEFGEFAFSLLIFTVALVDGANDRRGRAALLYEHAVSLRAILDSLSELGREAESAASNAELRKLKSRYRAGIERCDANHETLDFRAADAIDRLRGAPWAIRSHVNLFRWHVATVTPALVPLVAALVVAFLWGVL